MSQAKMGIWLEGKGKEATDLDCGDICEGLIFVLTKANSKETLQAYTGLINSPVI